MHDERWLRVFCQDLRVYDEQQARDGWTRDEREAWAAGMIVDARPEIRRRGYTWGAFLDVLEHESPRLRPLAPDDEAGVARRVPAPSVDRIDDPGEAERVAHTMVARLMDAQCPELSEVEIARVRFRFDRRVAPSVARTGVFDRVLDTLIAQRLGGRTN